LSAELERIAREYPNPADRAAEWLRFVQRQLRYFALALGEGGLVPRALDVIWTSRFGDCKDAARVFAAGARKLSIDACAALASTTHGLALGDFLPSPAAFNHCIVRLRLDGKTYWLDPTMPRQEGRLDLIYQPHAGWALPLTPEATLERLKDHEPVHYRHSEGALIIGPKLDSPAALTIRL
jgi:transglutaminase-like putative cysteine protease